MRMLKLCALLCFIASTGCAVVGPDQKTIDTTNGQLKEWKSRAANADKTKPTYVTAKNSVNGWIEDHKKGVTDKANDSWFDKEDMTMDPNVARDADAGLPAAPPGGIAKDGFDIFKQEWFATRKANAQTISGNLDTMKLP